MKLSKAFLFCFFASLGWAVSIILSRIILQSGESAYNLAFWTGVLASPFWMFLLYRHKGELKKMGSSAIFVLLGMGFNGLILDILEPMAIKYSTAISYSFLIRTVMLFTIIFAFFFLGEKITRKKIVLLVLTLVGAYLLTTKGRLIYFSLGDTLTILEAALIALGNNILGKLSTKHLSANAASIGTYFVSVVPLVLIVGLRGAIAIPTLPWMVVALTIVYITLTLLRFRAYREASASYVTMVFSFTPVFVAIIAFLFLQESMTPIQIVGGVCMVCAGIAAEKLKI